MEANVETPRKKRKYPERSNRGKITYYYSEFEDSIEEKPNTKKATKKEDTSSEDEEEKENGDTNDMDEDDEEISEYEKLRLKNVEENKRIMIELGLIDPNKEVKNPNKEIKNNTKKIQKKNRPKPPKTPVEPRKRSLRLLRQTPDGKNLPLFLETPIESPVVEEKKRIEEEELPMTDSGDTSDFLDSLKSFLSEDSTKSSVESTDSLIKDMRSLEFAAIERLTSSRVQSMCIHPMENKVLIMVGSTSGELGLWNADEGKVAQFQPHLRPINCISVCQTDQSKLFTTSFDGTLRRADINKSTFNLVYQTDETHRNSHITWHSQIGQDTLLVAHGTGQAGVIDLRDKKPSQWFHCHPRSIRTTHLHPTQPHYFITASGLGESKIWDLRVNKKHMETCVSQLPELQTGRGLTSAFFSPDGNKVVATSNDDFIRIYDTSDLANPKDAHKIMHDNHTGRWLSVFKTVWHPLSSELMFVGSMLQPRRIQLYSGSGRLLKELKNEQLATVVPVIALHPSLPIVVGGNSTGKAHLFTTPQFLPRFTQ